MSDFYYAVGLVVALAAGLTWGRVRPVEQARDWAADVFQGIGPQSLPARLLAVVLLLDYVLGAEVSRRRLPVHRIPAPRVSEDFGRVKSDA